MWKHMGKQDSTATVKLREGQADSSVHGMSIRDIGEHALSDAQDSHREGGLLKLKSRKSNT